MSSSIPSILATVFSLFFRKQEDISGFVIDASICGVDDPKALFERLIKLSDASDCKRKIILTTVTIDELDSLQKRSIENSEIARAILTAATNDSKHYLSVKINTSYKLADDCVLHFCEKYKSSVTLLTADKAMYLKALAMSIDACYFKSSPPHVGYQQSTARTLYPTKREGEILLLTSNFDPVSTAIRVIANGLEYDISKIKKPSHELHIGEDVLVAKNKGSYISFYDFRMISLYSQENCEIVYSKQIHSSQDINSLPKASYKNFIKDFIYKRQIELEN